MMKKNLTFFIILIVIISIGSLYGILHNMITYRISPEYYNKNLFYTFGVLEIDTYPKEYTEKNAPSNPLFEISKIGVIGSSVYVVKRIWTFR